MSQQRKIIDDYRVEEYREKKGKGFIKLLSELQWIYNAELDNDKPYEEERILLRKRVYFATLGSSLAVSLHFATSVVVFLGSVAGSILQPTLGEVLNVLGMLWKIATLSAVPLWMLRKYHLWDRGITRLLLSWTVLYGYAGTIAFLSFIFGGLSVLLYGGFVLSFYFLPQVKEAALWIAKHFPFLISPLSLFEYPAEFIIVVVGSFWYAKKLDKKHRFETKPYTLLDHVPED